MMVGRCPKPPAIAPADQQGTPVATMTAPSSPERRLPPSPAGKSRKRMSPNEREALIVAEAIRFFAERGTDGKTRDLAKRIGITQPLLYRYFPSKESLIERVYQEVYMQRWNPAWEALIADRGQPLEDRLIAFYTEYADAIYDYGWVRIFLFAALTGETINDRYLGLIKQKVLLPVCAEMRHAGGLPAPDAVPVGEAELELAWGLHGMFFYRAVRHFAYGMPLVEDVHEAVRNDVRTFLAGAPDLQKAIVDRG